MELYYFIENRPIIFTLILAALQWLVLEWLAKKYPQEDKFKFKLKWGIITPLLAMLYTKILYGDRLGGDLCVNVILGTITTNFLASLKIKTYKELIEKSMHTFQAAGVFINWQIGPFLVAVFVCQALLYCIIEGSHLFYYSIPFWFQILLLVLSITISVILIRGTKRLLDMDYISKPLLDKDSPIRNKKPILSTLHLCLYLRESLNTYGYDTKQEPNDAILIHGTFILERLLENRGIFTRPKLAFRLDLPHNLLCVSEELRIALSKVSEDYVTAALYDMNDLPQEVLELIAESSEKAIKCIKPLLKSQKT